jgi:hypothetical protein
VSRNNHQGVVTERFHRFLNKAVTLATNDRQQANKQVVIPACHLAAYAWNSAPIDGTGVSRSVCAVGREYRFPFDFEYVASPRITNNNAAAVHEYLTLARNNGRFAIEIVKLLLEEKRTVAREKINEGRHVVSYNIGDLVTVRVQVKSNSSRNQVAKLQYKSKGPFVVKEISGYGSYMLQRWNKESSALQKYHGSDMYLLPPCLQPSDPLDTPDLRYLNSSHGIVVNPLQPPLDIKLFNEQWFAGQLPTEDPIYEPVSVVLPYELDQPQLQVNDDEANGATIEEEDIEHAHLMETAEELYDAIQGSTDKLFFIRYAAAGTFRPRWYLVRVAAVQTRTAPSVECSTYTVEFMAKHVNDIALSDPDSRWWPEWHEYEIAADGVPEFGRRILLSPRARPDPDRFTVYSDNVDLTSAGTLVGPFDFEETVSRQKSIVSMEHWSKLSDACMGRGIVPPQLTTRTRERGRPNAMPTTARKRGNDDPESRDKTVAEGDSTRAKHVRHAVGATEQHDGSHSVASRVRERHASSNK